LSPSNSRAEINLKLRRYREALHNTYVLVIEPREILVELHARSRGWQQLTLRHAADALELPELSFRCLVGDLYRGTPLNPNRRAA
jgi:Uma2 family endonuclease